MLNARLIVAVLVQAANEDALPQGQAYHVEGLPFASTLQERLATGVQSFTSCITNLLEPHICF